MKQDNWSEKREHEMTRYLSEDELALPEIERDALFIQRKLKDQGEFGQADILASKLVIQNSANGKSNRSNSGHDSDQSNNEAVSGSKERAIMWFLLIVVLAFWPYKLLDQV